MTPTSRTSPELDSLIDEITVDCHDEDEQLMGFASTDEMPGCTDRMSGVRP
jgi:hypothetical protein